MPLYQRLDSVARSLIIGLIGLLPFFFVPLPWVIVMQSKMALICGLVGVVAIIWFVARMIEGSVRLPWNLLVGTAALLPIAYALSAAFSGFTSHSLVGRALETDTLAFIALSAGVLLVTAMLSTDKPISHAAIPAFTLGTFVLAALQIFHFFFPSISLGGVLVGTAGNAFGSLHMFAALVGTMVFLALELARVERGYLRYCYALAALVGLSMLMLTSYTDVWLMLFLSLVLFELVRSYRKSSFFSGAYWRTQWLPLLIALLALFFAVFGSFITNVLPERIHPVQTEVRPSWSGTLGIGQRTLSDPLKLVFGSGPNSFVREWGLHKPTGINQTPYWNIEFNTGVAYIPTSLITVGLLGVVVWLLNISALIFLVARCWFRIQSRMSVHGFALSISVIVLALYHIVLVPDASTTVLLFLWLGILLGEVTGDIVPVHEMPLWHGWEGKGNLAAVIVFALALMLAVAGIGRTLVSEILINKGIHTYNTSQDIDGALKLVSLAEQVNPRSDRAHRAAVQLGLVRLRELNQSASAANEQAREQLQTTLETTIQHGLQAVSIDNADYQNWLELASLYAELAGANVPGAYEGARTAYERARAENPSNPIPLLNLGQLEILQKRPDAALQYLSAAVALKGDLAVAYYLASQIYASKQDYTNALPAASNAIRYAPQDSRAWYNGGAIAYSAKDYTGAAAALEQALKLQPQYANALYFLGLTYYRLDRKSDALKTFEALNELDPGNEVAVPILNALRNGGPLPPALE